MNPDVKRAENEGLGWREEGGLYLRNQSSYEAYLKKQASKLSGRPGWCLKLSVELCNSLTIRLEGLKIVSKGMSVVCLGARLGGEVEAFIRAGAFAIGVDINPGEDNEYVLHGDFHNLQFPDSSIDIVYCNCFDHCYNPDLVLAEIHRILKPKGLFLMECKAGSGEVNIKQMGSDSWDCLEWNTLAELVQIVISHGFAHIQSYVSKKTRVNPYGYLFRRA